MPLLKYYARRGDKPCAGSRPKVLSVGIVFATSCFRYKVPFFFTEIWVVDAIGITGASQFLSHRKFVTDNPYKLTGLIFLQDDKGPDGSESISMGFSGVACSTVLSTLYGPARQMQPEGQQTFSCQFISAAAACALFVQTFSRVSSVFRDQKRVELCLGKS